MSSIFDLLTEQLSGEGMSRIQEQLGTDQATTAKAVPAALGTLMSALAKNSANRDGAAALAGALTRDHDGSILDNLGTHLRQPDETAGNGILGHVLGNRQPAVQQAVGRASGMDAGRAGQLLAMLALGLARRKRD